MVRRALNVVLCVAGAYVALMLLSGLAIKALLSKARIQALVSSAEARLPVKISAGGGDFDLIQWFRMQPSITLRDIAVANPEGFPSTSMISAREASVQVRLFSLFGDRIEVLQFGLRNPEVTVTRNRNGVTNVEGLAQALAAERGASAGTGAALALSRVSIESGVIQYLPDEPGQGFTVRDIDLSLADFSPDRTCRMTVVARLFESRNSRLEFRGKAGPFGAGAVPAEGDLTVTLAPAEISAELRNEYFGDLLRDPPAESRAALEAAMRGDLMGTLEGGGKLALTGLEIGRSKESRLPFAGEAPLRLTVGKLLQSPSMQIDTRGAALRLGQGQWKGAVQMRYAAGRLEGASSGSVTGVRIEEMLRSFTSTSDAMYGLAEIPEYSLRFAGKNSQEIMQSLTGNGQLRVEEGRITLFNLLDVIRRQAQRLLGGETPRPGETDFTRFRSRFDIRGGEILLSGLRLESPVSDVTGSGLVGFDHRLSFDLATEITGDLASKLGGRPDPGGVARVVVPVKVSGTVESPRVYPDISAIVRQRVTEKAKGLFESLFKKKAEEPKP